MGSMALAKKEKRPLNVGRINHLVRQVEMKSSTGATGFTLLKMASKPVARLVEEGAIGPAEFIAAQEFFTAYLAITGALWIKPLSLERRDRSYGSHEPSQVIDAQERYKAFAKHWSILAKRGDPMLQILACAVIDEWPFHIIESKLQLRHGKARKAVIRGLRDYAARAGWVSHGIAAQWKTEAADLFKAQHPSLALAMASARAAAGRGNETP